MCLFIASKRTRAEQDILVYKCLDICGKGYCTPFQYMPIEFNSGVKELWMPKAEMKRESDGGRWVVNRGFHAYRDMYKAFHIANDFVRYNGTSVYYALIPKGSDYYIGGDEDIVSTELIIFETEKAFEKYVKEGQIKYVGI